MAERKYYHSAGRPTTAHNTWKYVRSNLLTVLTIIGIVLGITFGCILRNCKEDKWSQREQVYVKFGGEIFLRMLRALTLPLILSSVIAALGSLDLRLSGKVGTRTILFYLLTTVCAVFLGIILVVTIHPGSRGKDEGKLELEHPLRIKPRKILNADVMMDMVRNMFPSNLFQATLYQYETILDMPSMSEMEEGITTNHSKVDLRAVPTKGRHTEGANILGLLMYSCLFGIALTSVGPFGKPVLRFFRCLSQIVMIVSSWILWLAPAGIFCLLAGKMLEIDELGESISKTGMYVFTVILGLLIHGLLVLPILYFVITGSSPFIVFGNVIHALVTAFGTASSTATLPATVACVEDRNGVDPRIARFVLPIGAVMNMDGTGLYEAVAAVFLAQLHGISMDLGSIVAVSVIATVVSIGASGIPHAGMVTMTMMMNLLGLPAESIAFIIPVDFILDRCRTTMNVLGDCLGASLVDKLCEAELTKLPIEHSRDLSQSGSTEVV